MTTTRLDDRVVLISGAAGGIGAATARRLCELGAHVVLADLDADALAALVTRLGDRSSGVVLDVTDSGACAEAVAATLRSTAGLTWCGPTPASAFGPVEQLPGDTWRHIVEVNLVGAYNLVPAVLPAVIEQRGYVAFIASWASFAQSPGHSASSASKAALEALANSLRSEVAHQESRSASGWAGRAEQGQEPDEPAALDAWSRASPFELRQRPERSGPRSLSSRVFEGFAAGASPRRARRRRMG